MYTESKEEDMINRTRLQPLVCLDDENILGYEVLYKKEAASAYPSASVILENVSFLYKHERNLKLFINLTVTDVTDANFCASFMKVVDKENIDASNIVLEVSENTNPDSISQARDVLKALHDRGVKIALDDFGTEYSGLFFLKELPVDVVKIDKKFIQEAPLSRKTLETLRSYVKISKSAGCDIVAEGIETLDQLDLVKNAGIDIGQGFLFSAPVKKKKLTPFIHLRECLSCFPWNNSFELRMSV